MKFLLFIILLLIANLSVAQTNTQNIRGTIVDKFSQSPIIGASVQIVNNAINKGTQTDANGYYILSGHIPSRYEIKITFVGYKDVIIPNIVVNSGKEVILDITMKEDLRLPNEVLVNASNKANTVNKLASISARTFSMEEVNRYAGERSDRARQAANFAGVSAQDNSRNDIVIRGNSPVGILWRIDGMNITNPNHFASVGTTGGAVSALNTNLLKSSDFFTSAWPSEYSNAISGVFDLGFRNGNSQKRETTVLARIITELEATTEGPINKAKGSSYLVGYRYALASVAQAVGVYIGTNATPNYSD